MWVEAVGDWTLRLQQSLHYVPYGFVVDLAKAWKRVRLVFKEDARHKEKKISDSAVELVKEARVRSHQFGLALKQFEFPAKEQIAHCDVLDNVISAHDVGSYLWQLQELCTQWFSSSFGVGLDFPRT